MLYMVIEYFNAGAAPEIYRRARERGRHHGEHDHVDPAPPVHVSRGIAGERIEQGAVGGVRPARALGESQCGGG